MPMLPMPAGILVRWFQRRFFVHYPLAFGGWLLNREFPDVLLIELTNDCNQSCPFCSRELMTRHVGHMPFEVFKALIDQAAEFPHVLVRIVGLGEASLHPRFRDCIRYAAEKEIPVEITSNGQILEALEPGELLDSSIVSLSISIDGFNDGSYEKLRPGGNYSELRRNISEFFAFKKQMKAQKPHFTLRNVLLGKTPQKRAEQASRFRGEWSELCDRIGFNDYIPSKLIDENESSNRVCDDILYNLHIEWDGRTPLCSLQHTICEQEYTGNVYERSIAEVWREPRRNEVRQAHVKGELSPSEFCKKCPKTRDGSVYRSVQKEGANKSPILNVLERTAWRLIR